jgi:hypothetical protein
MTQGGSLPPTVRGGSLEIAELVADTIVGLAWPVSALLIVFWFRKQLRALISEADEVAGWGASIRRGSRIAAKVENTLRTTLSPDEEQRATPAENNGDPWIEDAPSPLEVFAKGLEAARFDIPRDSYMAVVNAVSCLDYVAKTAVGDQSTATTVTQLEEALISRGYPPDVVSAASEIWRARELMFSGNVTFSLASAKSLVESVAEIGYKLLALSGFNADKT